MKSTNKTFQSYVIWFVAAVWRTAFRWSWLQSTRTVALDSTSSRTTAALSMQSGHSIPKTYDICYPCSNQKFDFSYTGVSNQVVELSLPLAKDSGEFIYISRGFQEDSCQCLLMHLKMIILSEISRTLAEPIWYSSYFSLSERAADWFWDRERGGYPDSFVGGVGHSQHGQWLLYEERLCSSVYIIHSFDSNKTIRLFQQPRQQFPICPGNEQRHCDWRVAARVSRP